MKQKLEMKGCVVINKTRSERSYFSSDFQQLRMSDKTEILAHEVSSQSLTL